jgi:hypothetical protein
MAEKITDEMVQEAHFHQGAGTATWKQLAERFGVSESGLRSRVNKYRKAQNDAENVEMAEAAGLPTEAEVDAAAEAYMAEVIPLPVEPAPEPVKRPKPMTGRKLVDVQVVAINRQEAREIHEAIEKAATVMGIGTFDQNEKLWIGLPDTTAAKLVEDNPFGVVVIGDETYECRQCKDQFRAHCFSVEHKTRYDKTDAGRTMLPASEWRRDLSRCRFVCRPAEDRKNKGDREERRSGMLVDGRRFEAEQCRDPFCADCLALKARAAEIKGEGLAKGVQAHILAMEEKRKLISAEQRAARAKYEAGIARGKTITEAVEDAGLNPDDCPMCLGFGWVEIDADSGEWIRCVSDWHPEEETASK